MIKPFIFTGLLTVSAAGLLACSGIPKTDIATDCLARPACAADIAAHGGPSDAERVVVYLQGGPIPPW